MAKDIRKKKIGLQKEKKIAAGEELLTAIQPFDPAELQTEESNVEKGGSKAVLSPLGPPQKTHPEPIRPESIRETAQQHEAAIAGLEESLKAEKEARRALERAKISLETAVAQAQEMIADLKQEKEIRIQLERELAGLEVEVKQMRLASDNLEEERERRLTMERELATLRVRADRTEEIAAQLAEERKARVTLEREKATLDVQVENLKKMDAFLSEERQARMNAQSRAANAEARLARLEGEIANDRQGKERGFFGRLRGR